MTFHLNHVVEKLGASSKSQAIFWALKQGLVRLNIDATIVGNVDECSQWFLFAQLIARFVEFDADNAISTGLILCLAQHLAAD
ncbi:hypothetical protein [Aeromonas hydrophila]|uniref:hypothetical protein n=1 Tax=Aeromonas hydrophila TaxID=644 RepID=UPI001F61B872|nr:hypothetical protein [Aeromonas hydrophila]